MMSHVNIYFPRRPLQREFFGKHCNNVDFSFYIILRSIFFLLRIIAINAWCCRADVNINTLRLPRRELIFTIYPPTPCNSRDNSRQKKLFLKFKLILSIYSNALIFIQGGLDTLVNCFAISAKGDTSVTSSFFNTRQSPFGKGLLYKAKNSYLEGSKFFFIYSPITKTRLFKYIENFTSKN